MARRNTPAALLVYSVLFLAAGSPAVVHAAGPRPEQPAVSDSHQQRKYLLERIDDVAVVQLYVDGFEQLPLREKILSTTSAGQLSPDATSLSIRGMSTRWRYAT